jgi:hypothetical protein
MEFKKAVKSKQRLRLAIDGVSGSGKTYTALAIASGMGNRIAMIDSEHGSAALYADRFDFDTLELESFQIEDYTGALDSAAAAEYPIVIIDSTSHAWDALVERVERIAMQRFGGNTFRGWGEGTPLQKKLIEAMLNYPGHVIVTCRSKTEYSVEKNDKGQTTIKKVGTAAVQRQGFEYEFTMAMTMDANHIGFVTKDRTSKFQDQFIEKPGKEFGKRLIEWLNEGAEDFEGMCLSKKKELGNILNTADEAGPLFKAEEIEAARVQLRELRSISFEEQLPIIEKLLNEKKQEMLTRMEKAKAPASVPAKSSKASTAKVAANTTKTGPTVRELEAAAAVAEAELNNMADNGFPPDPAPDLPGMYQEEEPPEEQAAENSFDDDIPWKDDKEGHKTKAEKPDPDLDIF